uniref:Protein AMBP n=1 Tax=Mola mola TaxID=94237 RepID=A0A3Q3XAR6_MOLML
MWSVVPLMVLGLARVLQAVPGPPEPVIQAQDDFDLARFMGKWYEVAVVSTCPHFMERKHNHPVIIPLQLQRVGSEGNFTRTASLYRHGMCRQTSMEYELTSTPGRFYRYVARLDTYVVHTNYNEYAMVIMILPTTRSTADKSISVRLFSRSKTVRATLLEEFKTLAREHGMTDDSVIVKQDKVVGRVRNYWDIFHECVTLTPLPPSLPHTEACKKAPDVGPCFGIHLRYFYNSTSMSCELFKFGGCLGNQNNFETERECLQRCRTEAACRLPLLATPCTHQPPIWAFDSSVGLCVPYKDGFCQTNANKFYSKAECDEYCGTAGAGEMRLHEQTQSDTS